MNLIFGYNVPVLSRFSLEKDKNVNFTMRILGVNFNIDFGISKIIELADKWLEGLRDKPIKSMAKVIYSAGLLVFMVKTLDNVFRRVVEENQLYDPSWPRDEKNNYLD